MKKIYLKTALQRWWLTLPLRPMAGGAFICVLGGVLSRAAGGSPYVSRMTEYFEDELPSVTLMSVLWILWYALLGAELAKLLVYRGDFFASERCLRAALPYVTMLYIGYLWYPVFFGRGWLVVSVLICVAALVLCIMALRYALSVRREVSHTVPTVLIAHGLWLLWLTAKNAVLLFRG